MEHPRSRQDGRDSPADLRDLREDDHLLAALVKESQRAFQTLPKYTWVPSDAFGGERGRSPIFGAVSCAFSVECPPGGQHDGSDLRHSDQPRYCCIECST